MADIKDVIETLDTATAGFEKVVAKSQMKIYDEVITLLHSLDIKNGKVQQSISNLKKLNAIKAKLKKVANNSEYMAGLGKFVDYFDVLARQQREYFTQQFAEAAIDKRTDKEARELIRKQAIQNTIDSLSGDGLSANVTNKINDILVRAVTSGARFADLSEELSTYLNGPEGGQGALARYANTYATTAISQYTGNNNKIMTDGLGTEWYMYVGSTIETTREFCDCLTAKRYIHRSEFRKILSGNIDGHQCKMYAKTGLPLGMIEGTNEENFQVNCGGWNCRHQLVPVHELAVPADVRAKFEELYKIQSKVDEYKSKNEDLELPTTKGKLLVADPITATAISTFEALGRAVKSIYKTKVQREKTQLLKSIISADGFSAIEPPQKRTGGIFGYKDFQYDYKNENEVPDNIQLARKAANEGYNVYLIPNIAKSTSGDYVLEKNGKVLYFEGKLTNGRNGISNASKRNNEQSDRMMIQVTSLKTHEATGQILALFKVNTGLKELWLYCGGRKFTITRQWVFSPNFTKEFSKQWAKK